MNKQVRDITIGAFFIGLMCIMAQVKINLTGYIPITLQTLGIYIIGSKLRPNHALKVLSGYLLLGAIGVPVFSNFNSGLGYLLGATGGYIIIFPIMAYLISYLIDRKINIMISYVLATILLYSVGTIWFMAYTGYTLSVSLTLCVYPFLIGDSIKIVISYLLNTKLQKDFR